MPAMGDDPGTDLDVLVATDLRLPGGTTQSVAEEVTALARAGYAVGLVQAFGPLVAKPRAFAPAILDRLAHGDARLVPPTENVVTPLVVLRHPAVFERRPEPFPTVMTERVVLVANQAATSAHGRPYFDPGRVDAVVTELFGVRPLWAPIGPLVRRGLADTGVVVRHDDWVNIIDVDAWAVDRAGPRGAVPVIGRHTRPQAAKWPSERATLVAAYPTDGSVRVKVLGGADPAAQLLGRVPGSWEVEPFGSRHPRDFLADVDFVVYYHHAETVEAFGRTVLEGLASGAVAVVDPVLRPTFGDAALYSPPHGVRAVLLRLHGDPAAWREQAARGQQSVRERFGHEAHIARITDLIGPAAGARADASLPKRDRPSSITGHVAPTALFVSGNGAGMGHLTRLLAMARRVGSALQPVFLSLSLAAPAVGASGFPWEYVPSRATAGLSTADWNKLFERRFERVLEDHRPAVVVFDGTWPYRGLLAAIDRHPAVHFVWSRRAMWRQETPSEHLELAERFSLVLEPGELAAEADRGPTVGRGDALSVRPITLLDRSEALGRDEAAQRLGVDPQRPVALITLGAGNINDISSDVGLLVRALFEVPGLQVVTTRPAIAARQSRSMERVTEVAEYPLSACFAAVDMAFSAAGYNSFHELVAFGVPSAFIPNAATRTDDQGARARYAGDMGIGLFLPQVTPRSATAAVRRLNDSDTAAGLRERCLGRWPGNGAADAMAAITALLPSAAGGGSA